MRTREYWSQKKLFALISCLGLILCLSTAFLSSTLHAHAAATATPSPSNPACSRHEALGLTAKKKLDNGRQIFLTLMGFFDPIGPHGTLEYCGEMYAVVTLSAPANTDSGRPPWEQAGFVSIKRGPGAGSDATSSALDYPPIGPFTYVVYTGVVSTPRNQVYYAQASFNQFHFDVQTAEFTPPISSFISG